MVGFIKIRLISDQIANKLFFEYFRLVNSLINQFIDSLISFLVDFQLVIFDVEWSCFTVVIVTLKRLCFIDYYLQSSIIAIGSAKYFALIKETNCYWCFIIGSKCLDLFVTLEGLYPDFVKFAIHTRFKNSIAVEQATKTIHYFHLTSTNWASY